MKRSRMFKSPTLLVLFIAIVGGQIERDVSAQQVMLAETDLVSIERTKIVVRDGVGETSYAIAPQTRVGLYGNAKLNDVPTGTPIRVNCKMPVKSRTFVFGVSDARTDIIGEGIYYPRIEDANVAVYPFGLFVNPPEHDDLIVHGGEIRNGPQKGEFDRLILKGVLVSLAPATFKSLEHASIKNIAGRIFPLDRTTLNERVSNLPWPLTWANQDARNGDVTVVFPNETRWIGENAKVTLIVDEVNPKLVYRVNLRRTEPVDFAKIPRQPAR